MGIKIISGYPKAIGVIVLNPRIFIKVLDRLRMRGVEIVVPSKGINIDEIKNRVKVILVDKEGLVKLMGQDIASVDILVITSESQVDGIIEKALCLLYGKKEYNEVIMGVDVGPGYIAYAIVADGEITELGKVPDDKIPDIVTKIINIYPHKSMIIRVGASHNGPEIASRIHSLVEKYGVRVELVEEEHTTKSILYLSEDKRVKDKDITAAINISFKPGIKYRS